MELRVVFHEEEGERHVGRRRCCAVGVFFARAHAPRCDRARDSIYNVALSRAEIIIRDGRRMDYHNVRGGRDIEAPAFSDEYRVRMCVCVCRVAKNRRLTIDWAGEDTLHLDARTRVDERYRL